MAQPSPLEVLLVDDELGGIQPFVEKALQPLIDAGEITLRAMSRPIPAVEYIKRNNPAVLLLDLNMPDLTGHTLVEKVKGRRTLESRIPAYDDQVFADIDTEILVLTNNRMEDDKGMLKRFGINDYIEKTRITAGRFSEQDLRDYVFAACEAYTNRKTARLSLRAAQTQLGAAAERSQVAELLAARRASDGYHQRLEALRSVAAHTGFDDQFKEDLRVALGTHGHYAVFCLPHGKRDQPIVTAHHGAFLKHQMGIHYAGTSVSIEDLLERGYDQNTGLYGMSTKLVDTQDTLLLVGRRLAPQGLSMNILLKDTLPVVAAALEVSRREYGLRRQAPQEVSAKDSEGDSLWSEDFSVSGSLDAVESVVVEVLEDDDAPLSGSAPVADGALGGEDQDCVEIPTFRTIRELPALFDEMRRILRGYTGLPYNLRVDGPEIEAFEDINVHAEDVFANAFRKLAELTGEKIITFAYDTIRTPQGIGLIFGVKDPRVYAPLYSVGDELTEQFMEAGVGISVERSLVLGALRSDERGTLTAAAGGEDVLSYYRAVPDNVYHLPTPGAASEPVASYAQCNTGVIPFIAAEAALRLHTNPLIQNVFPGQRMETFEDLLAANAAKLRMGVLSTYKLLFLKE